MAATKKIQKSSVKSKTAKAKKAGLSMKAPRVKVAKKAAKPTPPMKAKKAARPKPPMKAKNKAPIVAKPKVVKKKSVSRSAKPVTPLQLIKSKRKKTPVYSKAELNSFRVIILDKIREANNELQSIEERLIDVASGEFTDEDSTYSMHMAEQGTDAMEREKAFLFASRERKFISHLEDALQRIASGNYGVCIVCGNLIEKGRLEAVPNARMCVNCKNDSKRGE